MKTFILILIQTFFFTSLLAQEPDYSIYQDMKIKEIYLLKEANITVENIQKHDRDFQKLNDNHENHFIKQNIFWIKIVLSKSLRKDRYIFDLNHYEVLASTFLPKQKTNSFAIKSNEYLAFDYHKQDTNIYYLKLKNQTYRDYFELYIFPEFQLPIIIDFNTMFLFFNGFILGLIMMVAIYNLALYYFNRQNSFLFYALMELSMSALIINDSHVFSVVEEAENSYLKLIYFTTIFAILFARSFLETKKYLKRVDKFIVLILILTIVDLLLPFNIIIEHKLLTFISFFLFSLGLIKMKQGDKTAKFFVIGWFAIAFSVYTLEYAQENVFINFLYIGSAIEAIMLSFALAYKIKQIKNEQLKQRQMMFHQSRLASMGDMIANIAHQWRQPLNRLAFICMNVEKLNEKQARSQKLKEAREQLEFMSQTIDDFRNFYAPSKEKESFSLAEESQNIIDFINYKNIEITLTVKKDKQIMNYKNEFKQVLLNLLSNAKDVLEERNITEPKISILIDKNMISIKDNAGGIKLANIEQIFDPYFSTKEQGLGIGLYMSKMIIEKNMGGKLSVQNLDDGVEFRVLL